PAARAGTVRASSVTSVGPVSVVTARGPVPGHGIRRNCRTAGIGLSTHDARTTSQSPRSPLAGTCHAHAILGPDGGNQGRAARVGGRSGLVAGMAGGEPRERDGGVAGDVA